MALIDMTASHNFMDLLASHEFLVLPLSISTKEPIICEKIIFHTLFHDQQPILVIWIHALMLFMSNSNSAIWMLQQKSKLINPGLISLLL